MSHVVAFALFTSTDTVPAQSRVTAAIDRHLELEIDVCEVLVRLLMDWVAKHGKEFSRAVVPVFVVSAYLSPVEPECGTGGPTDAPTICVTHDLKGVRVCGIRHERTAEFNPFAATPIT
jgi:hypothetical protein